jgi:hypothetical protein
LVENLGVVEVVEDADLTEGSELPFQVQQALACLGQFGFDCGELRFLAFHYATWFSVSVMVSVLGCTFRATT